jgi:peptidyl-prolyl cis-trans isomerase SDCCAG10
MEEFEVIDPREKTREIVGDKGKRSAQGKDWDRERKNKGKAKA